jgi:hypothetical protein
MGTGTMYPEKNLKVYEFPESIVHQVRLRRSGRPAEGSFGFTRGNEARPSRPGMASLC